MDRLLREVPEKTWWIIVKVLFALCLAHAAYSGGTSESHDTYDTRVIGTRYGD